MRIDDVESADKNEEKPNKLFAGDSNWPNELEHVQKSEVVSEVTTNEAIFDADDDSDPPNCERQQYAQYIMSTISELPESRAKQAMLAIKLFLQKWPGYAAADA